MTLSSRALSPPARPPLQLNRTDVWRLSELATEGRTVSSGHPVLDAELPGGGWPIGSLVEVLQDTPSRHVWQLLLPVLAQALQQHAGPVVLVGAPQPPFLPALAAQGLPPGRLVKVDASTSQARLWASEQALRCADVVALMTWLPQAREADLRRLHIAAQQQARLLFVFRPLAARHHASPARLQLQVEGAEALQVRILKRRGPPLEAAVTLPAHSPRLAALLAARKGRGWLVPVPHGASQDRSHVLDRIATHA